MPRAPQAVKRRGRPKLAKCKNGHLRTPDSVDSQRRCRQCRYPDLLMLRIIQREYAMDSRAEEARQSLLAPAAPTGKHKGSK
jgi:hypothetical protein